MRALALLTLALCAAPLGARAAGADQAPVALRFEVESRQVVQGDPFELDVVLTTSANQVDELSLPDLSQFTILRESRSSSTQVQLRNSKRSVVAEQRFVYLLRADDAGKRVIGEASARVGQSVARAAALTIEVIGSADPTPAPLGAAAGARFGNAPPSAFLEVTVDRSEVFVGEQLTATTELYTQQPLSQWPRLPSLKPQGFLCVSLLGEDRAAPTQKTIAGRSYYLYQINKDALFPLGAGTVTIPAQQIDVLPAGSMFNRARPVGTRSEARAITVKPLPDEGRPARFATGNVGTFTLEASVRPKTTALGQPVTLTVAATGRGMLDQLELPAFAGTDSARVFPPNKKIERASSTDVIAGRVSAEMLVQPSREGTLTIPPLSMWVFDPDSGSHGQYVELRTPPLSVVVQNRGASTTGADSGGALARQVVARGARPLKAEVRPTAPHSQQPVWLGLMCALAGAAALTVRRVRDARRGAPSGQKQQARLERERRLEAAAARADLAGVERVLLDALAERFGAGVRSRTTVDLLPYLVEQGASERLAQDVVAIIRDVEASRYAPSAAGERARMVEAIRAVVRSVEELP